MAFARKRRKDSRHWTAYWVVDGKQHSKGGFPTKPAALDFGHDQESADRRGEYIEPTTLTLRAFYEESYLPWKKIQVQENTWRSYDREVRGHILGPHVHPNLGDIVVPKITRGRVEDWIVYLRTEGRLNGGGVRWTDIYKEMRAELGQAKAGRPPAGREPSAVTVERAKAEAARRRGGGPCSVASTRYYVVVLHDILKLAVRRGVTKFNAADGLLEDLRPETRPKVVWTAAQVDRFLASCWEAADRYHDIYALDLATGLRRGELLGLEWARHVHIDDPDEEPHLLIQDTLIVIEGEVKASGPKTAAGYRRVTLDDDAVALLRRHREVQGLERMMAGDARGNNDLVFCNEDGTQLHPDRVSDAFDRAVAKAEVPRIPFKNMRHTHATLGLLAGVDLKIMSARLGHASVSITADVYQQVIDGMDEDAARRIGALVFRTKRTRG